MQLYTQERREEVRFPLSLKASIAYRNGDATLQRDDILTSDVSSRGAFLLMNRPPHEGTRLSIGLAIASPIGYSMLLLKGFVLRRDGEGIAVRFERAFDITPVTS